MPGRVDDQFGTWINRSKNMLEDYRKNLREIELLDDVKHPRHAKEQAKADLRSQFEKGFKHLEEGMTAAFTAYETRYNDSFVPKPKNDSEAVLNELKMQRAWVRIRASIEYANRQPGKSGTVDPVILEELESAARRGDLVTIQAIREELPAYLKTTNWSDAATDPKRYTELLIQQACGEHLNKEQSSAKYDFNAAKYGYNRALVAARQAMDGMNTPLTDPVTLPSIEKGKAVVVEALPTPDRSKIDLMALGFQGVTISDREPK